LGQAGDAAAPKYEFEVKILATVGVRAEDESLASKALLSCALGSPSPDEIRLANEIHGGHATMFSTQRQRMFEVARKQQYSSPGLGRE
jgi:hypothetical protein